MSECEHLDRWFDRSICPEPCGSMHDVCVDCGVIVGGCPLPALYAKEHAGRLAKAREAMARHLYAADGGRPWDLISDPVRDLYREDADGLMALPELRALIGEPR